MDRVYLDTCVWCRPFDEPESRIAKEAVALRKLLGFADQNIIEIVSSSICLFEASAIDNGAKREAVLNLIRKSATDFVNITSEIERMATKTMEECRLDCMDAAHIAIAIQGNADIFLTIDDELIAKRMCISRFGINVNPSLTLCSANFIRKMSLTERLNRGFYTPIHQVIA